MNNWLPFSLLLVFAAVIAVGINLTSSDSDLDLGLEVYTGEGCIHCHSQYRRPIESDLSLWGPESNFRRELEEQQPVLFGNRRQGPDLSNVGLRRSREWNRIHLVDPRLVRPGSRMPSYAYLFEGDGKRGEALLDYLTELGYKDREAWLRFRNSWNPKYPFEDGDPSSGALLYVQNCQACHGKTGEGNGPAASRLSTRPRDLVERVTWRWVQANTMDSELELARLIKFGQPGSSMPGTEWLSDEEIVDLVRFLDTEEKNWHQ